MKGPQTALTRDVQVGRVDVFSGRRPFRLTVLQTTDTARPRLMSPWKEEDLEFLDYIGIGDIEVVLEHGYGNKASKLPVMSGKKRGEPKVDRTFF